MNGVIIMVKNKVKMTDKFLVIYNCCGVSKTNIDMWSDHIDSILKQKECNFDLVISGCMVSEEGQSTLIGKLSNLDFKNNIFINFINELHPINVTFNNSCILCSEIENYRGFLFMSSDIKFLNDDDFKRMFNFHIEHNVGISNFIVDNENWIPKHISLEFWNILQNQHADFPFGHTINCDCVIFDSSIYETYGKLMPDIFRSWCTESVFPFLCASVNKTHKCHDTSLIVHHATDKREGSSVISSTGCEKGCDDLYRSSKTVWERLLNKEAYECGFGYAESHHDIHTFTREHRLKMYLMHNKDAYIEDYMPKDTKRLVDFLRGAIFLNNDELDYRNIKYNFVKL